MTDDTYQLPRVEGLLPDSQAEELTKHMQALSRRLSASNIRPPSSDLSATMTLEEWEAELETYEDRTRLTDSMTEDEWEQAMSEYSNISRSTRGKSLAHLDLGDISDDEDEKVLLGRHPHLVFRIPEPRDEETKEERHLRLRLSQIEELLSTEENYVANLNILVTEFLAVLYGPGMKANPPWLEQEDIAVVFSNVQGMHALNTEFLRDLRARLLVPDGEQAKEKKQDVLIGDLLLAFAPFFKLYTDYVNNHSKATHFIRQVGAGARPKKNAPKRYNKFRQLVAKQKKNPSCNKMHLLDFLVEPCQRVPRYELVLEQLIKYTPEAHQDHAVLVAALASMKETANAINESLRSQHQADEVLQIQEKFEEPVELVSNQRVLVREGELWVTWKPMTRKIRRGTSGSSIASESNQSLAEAGEQRRWAFLFNDLFVIAEKKARRRADPSFVLKHRLPINQKFQVAESKCAPILSRTKRAQTAPIDQVPAVSFGDATPFVLKTAADEFVVKALTQTDTSAWEAALNQCAKEYRLKEQKAAEDNPESGTCHVCGVACALLSRQQCAACRKVVHDECSQSRLLVPGGEEAHASKQRVCDKCAPTIRKLLGDVS